LPYHTALARSVVQMVEGADASLRHGGREFTLEPIGDGLLGGVSIAA
jgi:hypothetical protein